MSLVNESTDDLGVAVPLVDRGVGGEEVDVLFALGSVSGGSCKKRGVEWGYLRVPDEGARSFGEDDRERVVVVGGVGVFKAEGLGGGGGVDAGGLFGSGGAVQAGAGDGGCHGGRYRGCQL